MEAALAHLFMDALAQRAQMRQGSLAIAELLEEAHRAIDRDPGHDLRVGEVATAAADLPDAVIRALPYLVDMVQQSHCRHQRLVAAGHAHLAPDIDGVHDLAEDIELELAGGGIADTHRLGALVARQLVQLELGEPPAA